MSAAAASRALLRRQPLRLQLRQQSRRSYADSTTDKAKEAASKATSKASEGLSRVTSSAGPAISKAASGIGGALSSIGGRTGRLIQFVSDLIPPTIYYSKVGLELSKIIFQGQKMAPPNVQQFQSYFSPLIKRLSNPSSLISQAAKTSENAAQSASQMSAGSAFERVRNVDRGALARGGVVFAEILGFFTVGEMIGRLKIVGYHGEVHHEH